MVKMDRKINGSSKKVAIIGAGYVGGTIAYAMSLRGLADEIVLIDKNPSKAQGEALDIRHGVPGIATTFVRAGSYSDCRDSDMIIVTAGRNRKPGESRLDLTSDNAKIIGEVAGQLAPHYSGSAILVVTNPVDIMVTCCASKMDLPPGRVFGTGCILDTSRLVSCLSDFFSIGADGINVHIVGGHGEAQFPLWSRAYVSGLSVDEYCDAMDILWDDAAKDEIMGKVKSMGSDIIKAKERTHYGIATCVCYLADRILNRKTAVVSVSSVLQGEYGISGVALSIPSIVTHEGVSRRLENIWTMEETEKLRAAADVLSNAYKEVR